MGKTATLVRDEISDDVIRGNLTITDRTYHVRERPFGLAHSDQNGKLAVLDSCAALAELTRVTEGENFMLTILERKN